MDKETDRQELRHWQTNPHTDRWADINTDSPMDGFMIPIGIYNSHFFCYVETSLCVTVYFQPFQIVNTHSPCKEHQSEDKINTEHKEQSQPSTGVIWD